MESDLPYKINYIYKQMFLRGCNGMNYYLKGATTGLRGTSAASVRLQPVVMPSIFF
jgi:hypothetical protein